MHKHHNMELNSRGMWAVLVAQFLSALADNAILIAAIAIVTQQGLEKLVPALQESFVLPFILLAPFLGHIADRFAKGRVMLVGNIIKFTGALAMTVGFNPFVAYALIGVGASVYSPAKYGILSQMFAPEKLVRANGLMEASTIAAILLGVLLGGLLADHSLMAVFWVVMAAYGVAALINLLIPYLEPEIKAQGFAPWLLIKTFWANVKLVFRNDDARFSLLGTSVFWGSGTTLRLMLFAWVPAVLLIEDKQTPANLMGAVSIGIVAGAIIAGAWIHLHNVNRALIGGLLLGPVIMLLAWVTDFATAAICMVMIGLCGGLFVVPLNALLQERGHNTVGAGNVLAVQNFFENAAMLLFVALYGWAKNHFDINTTILAFGGVMLISIGALAWSRLAPKPE